MEMVLDLICVGLAIWCIIMYVRNTNKVIDDLIKQLKEKQKDEK
jgi:hypothetical protein